MPPFTLNSSDRARYAERRLRLSQAMQSGLAVIPTRAEAYRNSDTHYPYRFDSSFYYLCGFAEPDAILVIQAGATPKSILFCRPKEIEREIWEGFVWGPEAAQEMFGVDEAWPIQELDQRLPELLENQEQLYTLLGDNPAWDARIAGWVNTVRGQSRRGITAPEIWADIRSLVHELRLFKDDYELGLMRHAADISAAAHQRAVLNTQPGRFEYEVEAELLHEFTRKGSRSPAYPSIVAGGANACVLHYVENNCQLNDGELLLIDAGCEWQGYAADITRTYPIGKQFSPAQHDLYSIVLAAQKAAIDAVKIGSHWNKPHEAALNVLTQGLIDVGLINLPLEQALETEAYKRFYMHRTGHWLGLDVHDVGRYKIAGEWRPLEAGMVLTVEPGLYIRPADDIDPRFHNIGIRIEDDVVVTNAVAEVITAAAPKEISDLEALRREAAQRV